MGYGLWRARAVIEKVGGTISVDSIVNRGTTFDIKLPGAEGDVCDD
jgi:chemotaxis protein histidine kinase CheA